MSKQLKIEATKRDEELNPRQIRANGYMTATIYGKGIDSTSIAINKKDFIQKYKSNKDSIFSILLGKKSYDVKVKKAQQHNALSDILNVEFNLI